MTCPPFQEYANFIAPTKTSRRSFPTEDKSKIGNPPRVASFDAKENNRRPLSSSLVESPAGGRSGTFNNNGLLSDAKTRCKTKTSVNRLMSGTLLNNKSKWLREIYDHSGGFVGWFPIRTFVNVTNDSVLLNRDGDCFRKRLTIKDLEDNATIHGIVKRKDRIHRTSFKVEPVLSKLHARIGSRSTTVLDSHSRGNIIPAVNEALAVSVHDVLHDRAILLASKDCDSKSSFRRKLEEICALWNKFLKRKGKDDICKKRQKSCKPTEDTCQKRGEMCQRKATKCSERRKQPSGKQATVLCSGRKSCSHVDKDDRCKTRKEKRQSCAQRKDNDTRRAKEDLCEKLHRAESASNERQDSKAAPCKRIEEEKHGKSADKDVLCEQRKTQEVCQETKKATCEEKKKEECLDTKKVQSHKKEECPPVRKAPGCPEDHGKKKDC